MSPARYVAGPLSRRATGYVGDPTVSDRHYVADPPPARWVVDSGYVGDPVQIQNLYSSSLFNEKEIVLKSGMHTNISKRQHWHTSANSQRYTPVHTIHAESSILYVSDPKAMSPVRYQCRYAAILLCRRPFNPPDMIIMTWLPRIDYDTRYVEWFSWRSKSSGQGYCKNKINKALKKKKRKEKED